MKPSYFVKRLITGLFAVLTMISLWFSTPNAIAAPALLANAGSKAEAKANEDAANTKGFVREARDKVKEAARSNASKIDNATEGDNIISRKAKDDAATIQRRANEDADRTQKAIDNTKNAVEKAVDGIKNAFGQ